MQGSKSSSSRGPPIPSKTTGSSNNRLPDVQDCTIETLLLMDPPQRKKASEYAKRHSGKRSSTYNKRDNPAKSGRESTNHSGHHHHHQTSHRQSRTSSYAIQAKRLPPNFAENVLDHELQIDRGTFTMDTISELMLLY